MRVISGSARGTKLYTIEGNKTRPTTDRIKESMFNLIQFDVPDQKVLDLFAGSGALGLEAASRGAASVTMVERSKHCHEVIEENIKKCHCQDIARLEKSDVGRALMKVGTFDLILMDPPYEGDYVEKTLQGIVDNQVLNKGGKVVIEHKRDLDMQASVGPLVLVRTKNYGITGISIYSYDG